ncbi:6494_t:CDS:1 [Funneliformis mosseae]|uniref:6494_t:CDS:1 n=1 Tax=Funneliformis mosseae TaxID=27381 RepID=A0A9N8Z499_FUNMO|nr:6494_t:CDS:1 [Funneliformis mosseae]
MTGVVLPFTQQPFNSPLPVIQPLVKKSNVKNVPYVPPEIIRIILALLKDDKKTLTACALVNHTFNLHVTPILYHTVSFSFPYTFTLFAKATIGESQRSRMIRHLDLSGFSTIGLQKSNATIQTVVTPEILINILRSCTMLEAFSVSETLESAITFEVLQVLAFELKTIQTLDFCGLSSKQFGSALASLAEVMGRVRLIQYYENDDEEPTYSFQKANNVALSHLKRLSLHECPTISEFSTILTLLAHAPNLTHLDLGGCSISDMTLNFLATGTNVSRTLTHLLLARCKNISSEAIATLISQCGNLKVLNLYGDRDIATAISEYDLITILSSPSAKQFQTLDIGSSHITPRVLYAIQENCTFNLQHLGIAKAQIPSTSHLNQFLNAMPNIQYIDLTAATCLTPINMSCLLNNLQKDHSLHTVEMSEPLLKKLGATKGWKINENFSRRCYYTKLSSGGRKVHPRKLDVAESGSDRMSKIFKYYSFDV